VAALRGAEVTLIYGPGTESPPAGVNVIKVQTTQEMKDAFHKELGKKPDVVVSAAAAQDFVVKKPTEEKIRHNRPVELKLLPAPRIIDDARKLVPKAFIVGFKAEYGVTDKQLAAAGKSKLQEHGLNMVVANDVSRPGVGFGGDTSEVFIVTKAGPGQVKGTKEDIARAILHVAVAECRKKR
jgi:phosphopantothenoylcysteine decarboxylase/phosphopantothenate--cysteine ligase